MFAISQLHELASSECWLGVEPDRSDMIQTRDTHFNSTACQETLTNCDRKVLFLFRPSNIAYTQHHASQASINVQKCR